MSKKLTYEFVRSKFEEKGLELLETEYINNRTKMRYKCPKHPDKDQSMYFSSLQNGGKCKYCGWEKLSKERTKTHEKFIEEMTEVNPNIIILGTYVNAKTLIEVKCKKDNYVWEATPNNLLRKFGCPICSNNKILKGVNDIATTHPEVAKLFVNQELTYKFSYGSEQKVKFRCPDCKTEQEKTINKVVDRGLKCIACSDGISFPERFIFHLLKAVNIDFEVRKRNFKWNLDKEYDVYIKDNSTIIEMQGAQHKNKSFSVGRSLEEEIENDKFKKELALKNGIKNYFQIDAEHSTISFLKNSILCSDLAKLYNFNLVNWEEIGRQAAKSILIKACELYNEGFNLKEIAEELKITTVTVRKYLERGFEMKLCDNIF